MPLRYESSETALWKAASEQVIASLKKLNVYTFELSASTPTGKKVVGPRRVYKLRAVGCTNRWVVERGWEQVPGVDCGITFAPVCRLQSTRMVLGLAAEMDYEVLLLDVQTVFVNRQTSRITYTLKGTGI